MCELWTFPDPETDCDESKPVKNAFMQRLET